MKNILTGIRPTGNLHFGHYLGTVKNWVSLQEKYNTLIEIADVQAFTDNFKNPNKVRNSIREITIDLLSVGIDPNKSTIFIQSMIPEISELTIYYSNLVTVSRLQRNPTIKNEVKQKREIFGENGEGITYGFLGYPVNQAADITVFDGDLVPVGEDQLPLIEQCREIVRKFNSIYGETLKEPEAYLSEAPRIKGIDGNEKMGKSLGNAIYLADNKEIITKKIMSAVTDPSKTKKDDPANPKICMVYYYHELIKNDNLEAVCQECKKGHRGCVDCKKELIDKMMEFLKPIHEKRKYYEEHPDEVDKILIEGTKKAKEQASEVMNRVRESMKIDYFNQND